jgi:hypothetical protein
MSFSASVYRRAGLGLSLVLLVTGALPLVGEASAKAEAAGQQNAIETVVPQHSIAQNPSAQNPSAQNPSAQNPSAQDTNARASARLQRLITRRVQRDLARTLNVPVNEITVLGTTAETWPDQCLGLGRPTERCIGGQVRGWRIELASSQQQWAYRSDRTGQRIRLEPLAGTPDFGRGNFGLDTSRALLSTVSQQTGKPIAQLKIIEVQPATWNGCLGIFEPDRFCTEIAIAGFRTLISDGQTVWVYHLNESGDQVAQNATASGAKAPPLQVLFTPINPDGSSSDPELDEEVIFQSQLSGDLTGRVQRTVLFSDGRIYRISEQFNPATKPETTREEIKTLTPAQLEAFKTKLNQQRFPNYNRLRYVTEQVFADYPTTELQAPGVSVGYIDLEVDSLPTGLQDIVTTWNQLIQ